MRDFYQCQAQVRTVDRQIFSNLHHMISYLCKTPLKSPGLGYAIKAAGGFVRFRSQPALLLQVELISQVIKYPS